MPTAMRANSLAFHVAWPVGGGEVAHLAPAEVLGVMQHGERVTDGASPAAGRPHLRGMLPEEMADRLGVPGLDPRRAGKVFGCVVGRGTYDLERVVRSGVPRRVAEGVLAAASGQELTVEEELRAGDGFVKYVFGLPDGARVEAVRIPLTKGKFSVCVSSQTGCALGCVFCATAKLGAGRNLEAWEMVEQVVRIRATAPGPVTGVVFQGMGEPFLNYEAVMQAARVLHYPSWRPVAAEAITVSTAGVVPGIDRFGLEDRPYRLSVSLVAARSDLRRRLMPVSLRWPLEELMDAVRRYRERRGGLANLAYIMIGGVNLGAEDAEALGELLAGLPCRLSLIELSPIGGDYRPPDRAEREAFSARLRGLGVPVVRRYSGGLEIGAACGMLGGGLRRSTPARMAGG